MLLTAFVPLITAPLVTLATGALAPIGLAGLAGLSALPPAPPVAPPITPPVLALPPSTPTPTSSPTQVAVEANVGSQCARGTTVGHTTDAERSGHQQPLNATMPAGMEHFAYLVGGLSAAAGATAAGRARKTAPEPDSAAAPAAAATPLVNAKTQRRRRAKAQMLGRGYEYLDLENCKTTCKTTPSWLAQSRPPLPAPGRRASPEPPPRLVPGGPQG